MSKKIHAVVWNEFRHEKTSPSIAEIYPKGIHGAIADALLDTGDFEVTTATLDEPEHGLTEALLEKTDVLFWWAHIAHGDVSDEIVARVRKRVLEGMGLVVLHSGHYSKIFKSLMGTTGSLCWREATDKERLWNVCPSHPIAEGIGRFFELPAEEMYGEPFGIPTPDETVFISWFTGGEVFRSGATWKRDNGKIFYFRPGHETHPTFHNKDIQRVLVNAGRWARANVSIPETCPCVEPLEVLPASPETSAS